MTRDVIRTASLWCIDPNVLSRCKLPLSLVWRECSEENTLGLWPFKRCHFTLLVGSPCCRSRPGRTGVRTIRPANSRDDGACSHAANRKNNNHAISPPRHRRCQDRRLLRRSDVWVRERSVHHRHDGEQCCSSSVGPGVARGELRHEASYGTHPRRSEIALDASSNENFARQRGPTASF